MKIKKITQNFSKKQFIDIMNKYYSKKSKNQLFVKKYIMDEILYTAASYDSVFISNYDYSITKELIEELKTHLTDKERLFTLEAEEALKNVIQINVKVDSDYDCYVYNEENKNIKESSYNQLVLAPTVSFEKMFNGFEKEYGLKGKAWECIGELEEAIHSFYTLHKVPATFQIGGNIINSIQWEHLNLIGCYHNDYGDSGAVYVYVNNKEIVGTVDMC